MCLGKSSVAVKILVMSKFMEFKNVFRASSEDSASTEPKPMCCVGMI